MKLKMTVTAIREVEMDPSWFPNHILPSLEEVIEIETLNIRNDPVLFIDHGDVKLDIKVEEIK